jgi:hypothetical protein
MSRIVAFRILTGICATLFSAAILAAETRVLGVVVGYSDKPNVASPASWSKALFTASNSVRAFYVEGSGGKHALTGDVIPTAIVLPQTWPTGTCNTPSYPLLAAAIRAAGYRLEDYKTLVLSAVRSQGGCGNSFASNFYYMNEAGTAMQSMKLVIMWGTPNVAVLAHELLHTEGVGHANSVGCLGGALGPFCTKKEYGNPADIMGAAGQYQTTAAPHRSKLNWSKPVIHPGGAATYLLGPAYTPGPLPSAVAVDLGQMPGASTYMPLTLWIEYRAPLGFDARMLAKSSLNSFADGAMLTVTGYWSGITASGRYFSASCISSSCLLDMTPGDGDHRNGALRVGQQWSNPALGIAVRVDARTDTTMTVTVEKE